MLYANRICGRQVTGTIEILQAENGQNVNEFEPIYLRN